MDRQTRQALKTDKFSEEVFDVFTWIGAHRTRVIQGAIAVVVIVLAAVGWRMYSSHQAEQRQEALAEALRVDAATVGAEQQQPFLQHFPTQQEKDEARTKALSDVHSKYDFSQEGSIAAMYLAVDASEKGNLADAEKRCKDIVDHAPEAYSSLARLSLAQVYQAEGKLGDAQKVLQDAVGHPSSTVSKEEAQLTLARVLMKDKPQDAKKILDPLATSTRSAISRNAVGLLGEISQQGQ